MVASNASRASRIGRAAVATVRATPKRLDQAEARVKALPKQTTWAEVGILWGLYLTTISIPPAIATANYVSHQWGQMMASPAAGWLGLSEGHQQMTSGGDYAPTSSTGAKVAQAARAWAGKDYKPGVQAMCASWVRTVLKEAGVDLGVAAGSAGPLMADSFHGAEMGEIIHEAGALQPGDIVMFADTYNGPGRSPIPGRGRITHVGIYLGDGMMADRPTSSRPVQHRPISTFKFHSALRPSAYASSGGGQVDGFPIDAYLDAIAGQESGHSYSAVNPHSGALGKYQFMPQTLASTARACPEVGRVPSRDEFLGSPNLQRAIMRCYTLSALPTIQAKTDNVNTQCRMLASFHYSGNPDRWNNTRRQTYNGHSYPSIADYTTQVCRGIN